MRKLFEHIMVEKLFSLILYSIYQRCLHYYKNYSCFHFAFFHLTKFFLMQSLKYIRKLKFESVTFSNYYTCGHYFIVGIFPCGYFSLWAFFPVGIFPCGYFSLWAFFPVGIFPCGHFSLWAFFLWAFFCGHFSCGLLSGNPNSMRCSPWKIPRNNSLT